MDGSIAGCLFFDVIIVNCTSIHVCSKLETVGVPSVTNKHDSV